MKPIDTTPSSFNMTDYSSLSEGDNLSDSDWLDIASGRESDENDSDSERDEVDYLPQSRRSSISTGSSRDGDVEVWEGLADDSPDEGALDVEPMVPALPLAADHLVSIPTIPIDVVVGDDIVSDEQRVKDALDQSMISTLSASRSSSHGGQASIRDLRLSFPDPLTSSRDELNRSYEEVSPSEPTVDPSVATDEEAVEHPAILSPASSQEGSGSIATLESPKYQEPEDTEAIYSHDELEIMLYGTESPTMWTFVHNLMGKVAVGGNNTLVADGVSSGHTLQFHLQNKNNRQIKSIIVYDRTNWDVDLGPTIRVVDRPSLAIVFVPSLISFLPKHHTRYLVAHNTIGNINDQSWLSTLNGRWLVNNGKAKAFRELNNAGLLTDDDLDRLSPLHTYEAFEKISVIHTMQKKKKFFTDSIHTVTLVALISLFLGFAINSATTAFRSNLPPNGTILQPSQRPSSTVFNNSVIPPPTVTDVAVALIPSSLKDFALAVFNPAATSPATLSTVPVNCKPTTWSERVKSSKDLILRPAPSLSVPSTVNSHVPTTAKSAVAGTPAYGSRSLSLKAVNSLSEVADAKMKALIEVARNDLKELMDALDQLIRAISYQTSILLTKETGQSVRQHLQYRHSRARGRARQLKEMGGLMISLAGERLKEKTSIAKKKAHNIKENLAVSEAWLAYRRATAKAVTNVVTNNRKQANVAEQKRKAKEMGRKVRRLFSTSG